MSNQITEKESKTFNTLKAIAMLSVMSAHTISFHGNNGIFMKILTSAWAMFGTVGVALFFVLSGFFYHREPGDFRTFWIKKTYRIICPWAICSSFTYIVKVILDDEIPNLETYLRWILGSGTWYYYVTMLLILYFIFTKGYKKNWFLSINIVINIISIIALSYLEWRPTGFITKYLIPTNWCGFFAIGCLLRKYRLDIKFFLNKSYIIYAAIITIITFMVNQILGIYSYFHIISFVFELSCGMVMLNIADKLRNITILNRIGKNTLFIYLMHMQIVQPLCNRMPESFFIVMIKPLVSLTVMELICYGIRTIADHFKFGYKFCGFFGIKEAM